MPFLNIIISPAKKMVSDPDSLAWRDLPLFLDKTRQLYTTLRSMSAAELKALWKCNDRIAEQNFSRLQQMDLQRHLTPAILSYEGIQYQYMAPGVFTTQEFDYVQQHLRILSGFYGVLRPFDGITPYRLEMQAKLAVGQTKDLYGFWGAVLADSLVENAGCLINLASKEYSKAVSRFLPQGFPFITCVFGEEDGDRVVEKATACKMARGEMVRFMAEMQLENPEQIKTFDRLDYHFNPERSDEQTYVFVRPAKK